ncbi:MAG: hypothetical protein R3F43_10535 [bacterium]
MLDKGLAGRLYVRDADGHLVAELNKPAGRAMELGFEAGRYRVTLDQAGALARADLDLADGAHRPLAAADFTPIEGELAVARGGDVATATQEEVVAANIGIVPGLDTNAGRRVTNHVSLSLLVGSGWRLDGFEAGGVGVIREAGVDGAQLGGAFALNGGDLDGAQLAGALTINSGAVDGAQLAGAVNLAGGHVEGLQAAGAVNVAGAGHEGLQIAGAFNLSKDFEGAQIGVVNVADHADGLQIGIVNVASSMRGVPIGLFNFIGDGIHEVEIGATDVAPASLSVRLGSRYFYTTWSAGARFTEDLYFVGLGLGGRMPVSAAWAIDLRVTGYQIATPDRNFGDGKADSLGRVELAGSFAASDDLHLTFGPALNVLASQIRDGDDLSFGLGRLFREDDVNVRLWPGAFVGVTLF